MRLRDLRGLCGEQSWQAQQVVGGAAEDEDPVQLGEASELNLAQRSGLLEPAEGFLDKPSLAQAA